MMFEGILEVGVDVKSLQNCQHLGNPGVVQ